MNVELLRSKLRSLSWPDRRRDRRGRFGRRGERGAARYLKRQGCRILARNYRCPAGEIDLIVGDGDTIVFVEVKTRAGVEAQDPFDTIRPGQWKRIESAARYFLMQHRAQANPCRFDVVTVVWPPTGPAVFEHVRHAYEARRA